MSNGTTCLFLGNLIIIILYEGLQVTVHSFKEVCNFFLEQGISYILVERFCQDDFGRQRAIGHRRDNPTVRLNIQLDQLLEMCEQTYTSLTSLM